MEGKIFYGHKIVLVTASPRFQSMLSSKLSDASSTPTVQINDIRYHIFQLVMQFLYSGGCSALDVSHGDVLELMAAASFFQLEALLRYTEARCSEMVDVDNVVAMYIHAKVSAITACMCVYVEHVVDALLALYVPGLQCQQSAGILSVLSAAEHGRSTHLRRLGEASALR